MGLDASSRARFNLERAAILVLDPVPMGQDIMVQILSGFGAKSVHRCQTTAEAKEVVEKYELDLLIIDAMATGEGYDFVRWLRRANLQPNSFAPVLLTTSHTPISAVAKARDCGAHFIMTKPLTPITVLERIIWISREGRRFVECDNYVGPDRRFKNEGVPGGGQGRRREDLPPELGDATMPNMDQQTIDGLLKTIKVRT